MARPRSRDKSSCFEFAVGLIYSIDGVLLCFADGGEAVPDIAGTQFAGDLGQQVLAIHRLRQTDCYVFDSPRVAAADIQHIAHGTRMLERDQEGARDVLHMHEIAPLLAILEYHRTFAVEQPRGKDREHAGIWIGERLARAIDVEE